MNVIIANKYKDSLSSLNIDVIKRMDGEFDVETITETFQNFYFNRMILDITALKDHFNISVMQQLIAGIDSSKIILFLDNDPRVNNQYLSQIISLGIYNFTRELTGVTYLMENPNSYRDVAQYHDLANTNFGSSMSLKSGSDNNTSIPSPQDVQAEAPMQQPMQPVSQMQSPEPPMQPMMQAPVNQMPMNEPNPQAMMMNNMNMNMNPGVNPGMDMNVGMQQAAPMQPFPSMAAPAPAPQPEVQAAPNYNNINYNNPVNMQQNVPQAPTQQQGQFIQNNQPVQAQDNNNQVVNGTLVIGFKNLTDGAGSTSLVYMLKKQLKDYKVLAVEVNDTDFTYFNDTELISVQSSQVSTVKNKFSQYEIVLIDINNSSVATDGTCNEVIYLMEPSMIKLNTLMRRDRRALEKLKNSKIVLNKSMLTNQDVKEFEYEARVPIFYNLPPLDDRKENQAALDGFLDKLGVFRKSGGSSSGSGGLFGLFRK